MASGPKLKRTSISSYPLNHTIIVIPLLQPHDNDVIFNFLNVFLHSRGSQQLSTQFPFFYNWLFQKKNQTIFECCLKVKIVYTFLIVTFAGKMVTFFWPFPKGENRFGNDAGKGIWYDRMSRFFSELCFAQRRLNEKGFFCLSAVNSGV